MDFNFVGKVFGSDEIQLCKSQAARWQVSTLVNSLLEGCFDCKFEIRFTTQRPEADGKGMVDDFDLEFHNKNLDRRCLVDELSGGPFADSGARRSRFCDDPATAWQSSSLLQRR